VAAGGVEHGLDAPTPRMNPGVCALRSSIMQVPAQEGQLGLDGLLVRVRECA